MQLVLFDAYGNLFLVNFYFKDRVTVKMMVIYFSGLELRIVIESRGRRISKKYLEQNKFNYHSIQNHYFENNYILGYG